MNLPKWIDPDDVRMAAGALIKGALIIMPTDTVYGIAAHPMTPDVDKRLCEVKGRNRDKPIPLLAAAVTDVEDYGAIFDDTERRLADKFWPGPLTLVLRVANRTEGFRVPDCDVARELLREAGGILRVTSANISGQPPALTADEAVRSLGRFVDIVLDAGAVPGSVPSTVVKVKRGNIKVLREGAIPASDLKGLG